MKNTEDKIAASFAAQGLQTNGIYEYRYQGTVTDIIAASVRLL